VIFFYGEGRLGNQVFQYQALTRLARKGECVFAVGLEDLHALLQLRDAPVTVVTRNEILKRVIKYGLVPLVLKPLARYLRIFSYAHEPLDGADPYRGFGGAYRLQRGLMHRIVFVDGGFYQNAELSPHIFPLPCAQVRADLRAAAQHFIAAALAPDESPVCVHIRRGDYLGFASYGVADLALPERFYRDAMRSIQTHIPDAHFIFVTDDPEWVTTTFADVARKTVVSNSAVLDFAIMSECRGAILSNSTFSLAAALLMRDPSAVIGPRHWFGFRVGRWLPPRIEFRDPRLIYLQVPFAS
jgi:hypothetical protein